MENNTRTGLMDRPPPPLNFIRSFECAARHLSFTKAAQELGYTQAAVSTHIRALEKYVGRKLFVRRARSVALTEIGEAFLPTLRQALYQIDHATQAVATTSRDQSVIVACPMSLAENWLPSCLAAFCSACPEVEIVVNATIWDSPEDAIADISVSVNRIDAIPPGSIQLWNETLSLVCSPRLAGKIARVSDIASMSRIVVAGRQEYWTAFAEASGISEFKIDHDIKTNATNVALELATQGLGTTIAQTSLCETYIKRGLLAEPLQFRPKSPWCYYIRMLQGRRNQVAQRVFDHISTFVA